MPIVNNGGVNIHYEVQGTGPPLLMLNGWGAADEHWGELLPMFREHFTCILVDNRGVGNSDSPDGIYTAGTMAADALACVNAAGFGGQQIDLFGYSLGGVIAQQIKHAHPELVNAAVLVDTTPGVICLPPYVDVPFKLALRGAAGLYHHILSSAAHLAAHVPAWFPHATRQLPPPDPGGVQPPPPQTNPAWPTAPPPVEPEQPNQDFSFKARIEQLLAVLTFTAFKEIHDRPVPTKLFHGTNDEMIPTVNAWLLNHLIPNSVLEWVQGAPHNFFVKSEYQQQIGRGTIDFLQQHQISTPQATKPGVQDVEGLGA